jgi:cytochrome o ubiquinol oxidase subunit II
LIKPDQVLAKNQAKQIFELGMDKKRLSIGVLVALVLICALTAMVGVLQSDKALVLNPKGIIAEREHHVIVRNILLMLIVVVPTIIALFVIAWRYRAHKNHPGHDPNHSYGSFGQVILWIIPSIVIAVMMFKTWYDAHELDPYKPLQTTEKSLQIQVVALDWKWLFIYPEQGIATTNLVAFPEKIPIHFTLAADGSPMNSFWIPQLGTQIYAMTGMMTQLHIMANEPGDYPGRAAEINGEGLADMTFVAKVTSQADFNAWVAEVRRSPQHLDEATYNKLVKPFVYKPITFYSTVEKDLFHHIVMKYMFIPSGHRGSHDHH